MISLSLSKPLTPYQKPGNHFELLSYLKYNDQLPRLFFITNEIKVVREVGEGEIQLVGMSLILIEWIRKHSSTIWTAWQALLLVTLPKR
jgi:hypothetical protein